MTGSVKIIGCSNSGWFSRTIRKITKSKYSHVAISFLINDLEFIAEATLSRGVILTPGVRWHTVHAKKKTALDTVAIPLQQYTLSDCWNRTVFCIGDNYEIEHLVRLGLKSIGLGWLGRKFKDDPSAWICSEFVPYVLGWGITSMTPGEVMERLQNERLYS